MGELQQYVQKIGRRAREASRFLARTSTAKKDDALRFMASEIAKNEDVLLAANARDVARARQDNLEEALIDRLSLTPINIKGMIEGLEQIADLPDPIGEIDGLHYRPTGIQVGRMRVPLGVIGIIYESRPNVTADAAGLCLKAGNSAILRGGSEAIHSNQAIAACVKEGLKRAGLPEDAVQVIDVVDREVVSHLVKMTEFVDVIVPRGGKGLIEMISRESAMPVIKHLHGVCHVYIDAFADIDKAVQIADNAKTQRYGTCNTMESLLVHTSVAGDVLKKLAPIYLAKQVELRGDKRACSLVPAMTQASQEDWVTEYLAPILSIKVVDSLDEAIDHINTFGSHHTDAIVTDHFGHAQRFLTEVDSSSVMVNASTRFADGFEYGLGAEIGISTDKIHARGPVGLEGLTSQKYIVIGDGHIRG